jgi:hypothetical protein
MTTRRGPLGLARLLSAAACAAIVLAGCGTQPFGPRPGSAPAAGRIPRDAAVVTVTPYFGLYLGPRVERLDRAFTVTDPAKVARIAAVIDGLARFPAGMFSCPADYGGQMRLTFATGPGGPAVARVAAEYGGCRGVSLSVRGRNMPALIDNYDAWPSVPQRILAIAGVSWPDQPGDPT